MRGNIKRALGKVLGALGAGLLVTGAVLTVPLLAQTASASSGAAFTANDVTALVHTTTTHAIIGTLITPTSNGPCLNGKPTAVNCNLYPNKDAVWLNSGPTGAQLAAGTYFFVVLAPGQQQTPNDGSPTNLSYTATYTNGGTWTERAFTVAATGTVTPYGSTTSFHAFDSSITRIQLMNYKTTPNPGGVYIAAICAVTPASAAPPSGTGAPGVTPKNCKYDAFKVHTKANTTTGTVPKVFAPTVTKTAVGAYTATWSWTIMKSATPTLIKTTKSTATVTYTVTVTPSGPAISNVTVSGTITVTDPNFTTKTTPATTVPVTLTSITDKLSTIHSVCTVKTATGAHLRLTSFTTTFKYTCTLTALPTAPINNTVTIAWASQTLTFKTPKTTSKTLEVPLPSGTAPFTFHTIVFTAVDHTTSVTVTDTLYGPLGSVTVFKTPSGYTFPYPETFTVVPDHCTTHTNTASLNTPSGKTSQATVTVCGLPTALPPTVTKTAAGSYTATWKWTVKKSATPTLIETTKTTATFTYKVTVTPSGPKISKVAVSGTITVGNPNVTMTSTPHTTVPLTLSSITDKLSTGTGCTVKTATAAHLTLNSANTPFTYTCSLGAVPKSAISNTVTIAWPVQLLTFKTPHTTLTLIGVPLTGSTAQHTFHTIVFTRSVHTQSVTVTDTLGGHLGSVTAIKTPTGHTFTYMKTFTVHPDQCTTHVNTASLNTATKKTAKASVTVCGPVAGGLTMGFWQNKNGQALIDGAPTHKVTVLGKSVYVCTLGTWLRQYNPFGNVPVNYTCPQVATYVLKIIKAATCASTSKTCNSMLRAQMLATTLDVYFSTGGTTPTHPSIKLGGNKINAPLPLGGVTVDLTHICKMIDNSGGTGTCSGSYENASTVFGGASTLTVSQMLAYAASKSAVGGTPWYANVKATQVLAKDAFDAINNRQAFV